MKLLEAENVVEILRRKQAGRSDREFCKELGITAAYLGDIYAGQRTPGPKVLERLGLEKIVRYRKVA